MVDRRLPVILVVPGSEEYYSELFSIMYHCFNLETFRYNDERLWERIREGNIRAVVAVVNDRVLENVARIQWTLKDTDAALYAISDRMEPYVDENELRKTVYDSWMEEKKRIQSEYGVRVNIFLDAAYRDGHRIPVLHTEVWSGKRKTISCRVERNNGTAVIADIYRDKDIEMKEGLESRITRLSLAMAIDASDDSPWVAGYPHGQEKI